MIRYEGESSREDVERQLKNFISLDHLPMIEGFDFKGKFDFSRFIASFTRMGFQGSNLGMAIDTLREVIAKKKDGKEGLQLFLACTGNMISSGNRELIRYLVQEGLIDGLVTTAAGIEEDIIKCVKPFHLGRFDVKGEFLLDNAVGRIGNIFVPADRYLYLERFLNEAFALALERQGKEKRALGPSEFTALLGEHIARNEYTAKTASQSVLYWAAKKGVPIFCPAITDGAIGDIATFFKRTNPGFVLDVASDNVVLSRKLMDAPSAANIVLGGGVAKHFLLNSAIFREGFEYSIYITTATYFDGSDSGGDQEEAITWAKLKPTAKRVKVIADATIAFPLLVAGALNA